MLRKRLGPRRVTADTLDRAALELLGHQSGIGGDLAGILEAVRIIEVKDDRLGQA